MRYLSRLFLIAFAIAACGSSDPAPPALVHYVAAQEALADDDLDQAHQALQGLIQNANPTLKPLAEKAARAADLAAVRVAFKPLSEEVMKGQIPEGYVVAYCPMADGDKGAHWVQKDQPQIANPYFGASMLRCGVFKE
jgi:Cu(I)/Ag(I) efflux system membrane fusion protein